MPVITIPTKINNQKNTVIDNIFTNNINPDIKSGNITLAISDHLPSFIVIPKQKTKSFPQKSKPFYKKDENF